MKNLKNNIAIHCYKHNGSPHRKWEGSKIVNKSEIGYITYSNKVSVVESSGKYWWTKEPALSFFYYKKWYNIIAMFRDNGIYFYCNLASPIVDDGEALKYIDYDLDVKIDPDFNFEILDINEYKENILIMNYSDDLIKIINKNLDDLINHIKLRKPPFNHNYLNKLMKRINKENEK